MGSKVFVSYKHKDSLVAPINDSSSSSLARMLMGTPTTARDYVNKIVEIIGTEGVHIYKGEEDGDDLSAFKDETIATKLKGKIKDSSITVVLISKGMKTAESENDQWIPWEISYSLKEITSNGRTSKSNGLLAVILPDENGSYNYYLDECGHCGYRLHKTNTLFQILGSNMFNLKTKKQQDSSCFMNHGRTHTGNDHSYAHQVKWNDFINNHNYYINVATSLRDNIDNYNIQKFITV